ncbi:MAG TPA: hypothetical protein DCZ10_19885 [Pelotomaculum sp.]|nr:hypothetical protein [Pelotomaculum sp.]
MLITLIRLLSALNKGGEVHIKREDNALSYVFRGLRDVWRHREGLKIPGTSIQVNQIKFGKKVIDLENKIPAAVLDTIDALYPKGNPRPLLTKQKPPPQAGT